MKIISITIKLLILVTIVAGLYYYFANFSEVKHKINSLEKVIKKGPNGGRLFIKDGFAIELMIFERGTPPQFRAFAYKNNNIIKPEDTELLVKLKRLDGEENIFNFNPKGNFLIGDGIVTEPHSFEVYISAKHNGNNYEWRYESFEGRTQIDNNTAKASGIKTEYVEEGEIIKNLFLMGRIILNKDTTSYIRARFQGIVKEVNIFWGQKVKKGDVLARIESNKSLQLYDVKAPREGIVLSKNTNIGDVASDQVLFTIADLSEVWAEYHVFQSDISKIKSGMDIRVFNSNDDGSEGVETQISSILPTADPLSQTVQLIAKLDNIDNKWRPGMIVKGKVVVNKKNVPLRVKMSALQKFRDVTVVYARYNDTYEIRMLELGDSDDEYIEVISGIKKDTEYVTDNSFLIKADIDKSGATHDH